MRIPEERGYRSMKDLRRSCPTQKHPRKGLAVNWPMKQEDQLDLQAVLSLCGTLKSNNRWPLTD
jgi:hypothetical protein